ncbi:MAG: rRNA maturation RNase YbeY [Bacilli bacterium]|nr:rRNA maturation RNase YbeY [Bacilli bacterium]
MELDFINQGPTSYDVYEDKFRELMEKVFSHLNVKEDYIVDVSIIDNKAIHEVNRSYRGIDRPTDVISFAFFDDKEEKATPGVPSSLGQILISYEKAEEQAKEYGHSLNREMSFLFVHGMLHLLGYDHMTEKDEKIMFSLQEEILGGRTNER